MRRATILAAACTAALLIPVASGTANNGDHGRSATAKECAKMKKTDKGAFRAAWGDPGTGKHAMRNCIKNADDDGVTPSEFKNAAEECRAARDADPEGFAELWGTNTPNEHGHGANRNAFGKCVSATARGEEPPTPPVV